MAMIQQQAQQLPPQQIAQRAVRVRYTNWRGETADRSIVPIEIYWGKTEWHKEDQWLLKVWDLDRAAYRAYALKDIKAWL